MNQLNIHAIANLTNTTPRMMTREVYRNRLAIKHPGVILSICPARYRDVRQGMADWVERLLYNKRVASFPDEDWFDMTCRITISTSSLGIGRGFAAM